MNFSQELADDKYNSNDMGYFTNNNFVENYLWLGYKWIKPKGIYNRLNLNFNGTLYAKVSNLLITRVFV
jgi:hypothetical protein